MDIAALLNPRIPDADLLQDFSETLADLIPQLERHIVELRRAPANREIVAALFRGMHTIKGDAALCKIDVGVLITHPIETLLARVREGEVAFNDLLAEVVLLALDRLELAIESLNSGRSLMSLRLTELVGGLVRLGDSAEPLLASRSVELIESVTGFRPTVAANQVKPMALSAPTDRASDLALFQSLALKYEARSPLFKGRSGRLLRLALDTNIEAGSPVDPTQLEAAVYTHDIGMMYLPESIWLKVGRMTDEELIELRSHPELASAVLSRIPGWSDAAQMVAQHHEMQDGRGYPQGLKDNEICPGAKILAIVDAFESVTLKQGSRGQSRSLLRAVAEINACDNQFDPGWIVHFNQVIRRTLEA